MLAPIHKGVNHQMNDTLWIEPGKCPTNPENVPVNPENVPIFLNRKTLKQNTKTVRAKKLKLEDVKELLKKDCASGAQGETGE
jgi:hypothetical protein